MLICYVDIYIIAYVTIETMYKMQYLLNIYHTMKSSMKLYQKDTSFFLQTTSTATTRLRGGV